MKYEYSLRFFRTGIKNISHKIDLKLDHLYIEKFYAKRIHDLMTMS